MKFPGTGERYETTAWVRHSRENEVYRDAEVYIHPMLFRLSRGGVWCTYTSERKLAHLSEDGENARTNRCRSSSVLPLVDAWETAGSTFLSSPFVLAAERREGREGAAGPFFIRDKN